jgi:hypothetical protein
MTYPPQPGQPYGQQPDPAGHSGYPQSDGFPQQSGQQFPSQPYPPQQYPGAGYPEQNGSVYPGQQYPQPGYGQPSPYQGYGQQQYPQFGQVGGFGGPPAPPKKRNAGMWIGVVVIVVVLAAFGVTGFVAPGFLLSKTTSASPDAAARALADGLNKQDTAALTGLECRDAGTNVGLAINEISKVTAAALNGPLTKVTDTEYTANIDVTTSNSPSPYVNTLDNEGGTWCWKNIDHAGPGSQSSPPTAPTSPTI